MVFGLIIVPEKAKQHRNLYWKLDDDVTKISKISLYICTDNWGKWFIKVLNCNNLKDKNISNETITLNTQFSWKKMLQWVGSH